MRGFSAAPAIASYEEVYGLKAAAIAVYPMYKGLAQLVGMEVVGTPTTLAEEIDVLEKAWNDYDFFFVHFKYTDSRGEDGDFPEKVRMIEQFDAIVPRVDGLEADGADRHRRPQHARPAGQPQLASGADAVGFRDLPARRADGLRREARPPRRPGPFSRRLSHAAGAGPRGAAGEVRGVGEGPGSWGLTAPGVRSPLARIIPKDHLRLFDLC